jgi:hypothetical protein
MEAQENTTFFGKKKRHSAQKHVKGRVVNDSNVSQYTDSLADTLLNSVAEYEWLCSFLPN